MQIREFVGFDWDSGNRGKCQKHGVSLLEIEGLLRGSPRVAPDFRHADEEDRLLAIGRTAHGRPLFVVFTVRRKSGLFYIRPISARFMHDKEVRQYEAQSSDNEDR